MANETPPARKASFLSLTQLISLAIIITLAANALISSQDLAFVIFSIIYIYFLSTFAFPPFPTPPKNPPIFDPKNRILPIYVSAGAIIGLFLPLIYILQGIFSGDKERIKTAAPHLFLLATQVYMEGVVFSDMFAIPIHVFVPVFYNSKRIFSIVEWLVTEFSIVEDADDSYVRVLFGRALALGNMAFWGFNLFGFLLPIYLPRAFNKYYSSSKVKD
ncbi:uncharacterized protein [Euphorbia lathyris]|uniref:uncharacterized protein n=1 Tax=Euphorbia lathyris TaxID=212925 RepID=UPI003313164D